MMLDGGHFGQRSLQSSSLRMVGDIGMWGRNTTQLEEAMLSVTTSFNEHLRQQTQLRSRLSCQDQTNLRPRLGGSVEKSAPSPFQQQQQLRNTSKNR